MRVTFFQRNPNMPTAVSTSLTFRVLRYSKRARGGCYQASIEVTGDREEVWRLLDWSRYRVEINNNAGARTWWGYVREIQIRDGNVTAKVDVNQMSNRVAVAYTLTTNGDANTGVRGTTEWAENELSIEEFGRRELLETQGGVSEAAALAKRAYVLATRSYPVGVVAVDPVSVSEPQTTAAATILCEGWWFTFDWMYCSVPTQLVAAFETVGTMEQTLGCDYDDDAQNVVRLAQTFGTGASVWNVLQIGLYAKRVGVPAGTLQVAICALDEEGAPGTALASGTVSAADLDVTYAWLMATLSEAVELATTTRYALQVTFSGTVDQANYFVFSLDPGQGYAGGELSKYVTAWSAVAADMPFRLRTDALVASDVQILSIASGFGQFFYQVGIEEATGVTLESFRNGDNDALFELDALMDTGTAGGLRLLAEVDHLRQVRIFAMPAETGAEMYLRRDGCFYHRNMQKIDPSECPVGFWARLSNVLPASVDASRVSGLGTFFVEESEYDAERDALLYTPLGADDIFDFGMEAG